MDVGFYLVVRYLANCRFISDVFECNEITLFAQNKNLITFFIELLSHHRLQLESFCTAQNYYDI